LEEALGGCRMKRKQVKKMQTNRNDSAIAYQNKDIVSKVMAEEFKGKTFAVYGIDVPKVKRADPTNLPVIVANELRLDNLFELEDGSYTIVDYESKYTPDNKIKYIGYVARIIQRLYNENGYFPKLKLIIIYTADVKRGTTDPCLDVGCARFELTEAFLSDLNSEEIYYEIKGKLDNGVSLSDEDLMRLIIYPLTYESDEAKRKAIDEVIELANRITDRKSVFFVYKCILIFTDKVISDETAQKIRRRIGMMTKVEQIIEQEKIDAVNEAVDKAVKAERARADQEIAQASERATEQIALNLYNDGMSIEAISRNVGLSLTRLEEIFAPLKA